MTGLEAIAFTIIKGFAGILINLWTVNTDIHIENAPKWYQIPDKKNACVYTSDTGGYSAIDSAKNMAGAKINEKIVDILTIAVSDNTENLTGDEKDYVEAILKDDNLNTFVKKNITFPKIAYDSDINTAFVKACVDYDKIIEYQKNRMINIARSISIYRSEKSFDELDTQSVDDDWDIDKIIDDYR